MKTTLPSRQLDAVLERLTDANRKELAHYAGEPTGRQPVHTVYGGAHLFTAETANKLGELALRHVHEHAPDSSALAGVLRLNGALADQVYTRMIAKLEREAVEDFRIDFEDGFGIRPHAEEDQHAERTAREVARAMREGLLPPFLGIRVKPLNEELKARSARTLDVFVSTLLAETGGQLPDNFVITLPKVPIPEQVEAFVDLLELLEQAHGLATGSLEIELMIELTQTLMGRDGRSNLPLLLQAARGRCRGAHFGTYDYTASCDITAGHQVMDHLACDFAKHMMKIAFSQTGIFLSDGATNVMPTGDRRVVHAAWKTAFDHIQHSLRGGFYQGWDLHPGQLPIRYAACYAFFLESLEPARVRLSNFIAKAAQATLVGDVFDDAATGQGLLNYFLRALGCGAITLDEVAATGLSIEDIQTRSFVKILERRKLGLSG